MTEHEMEDLLWEHSEKFLNEPLTQHRRQLRSSVGRSDLIFTDRIGRFLIIEIKLGKLKREAIGQLHDYYGMVKSEFPNRSVELMVIANHIPDERKIACETYNIEPREISERKFREIASEVGYNFQSETRSTAVEPHAGEAPLRQSVPVVKSDKQGYRLSVGGADTSTVDATGFLSRCDDAGKAFFSALFERQKALSQRTKITWNHESGFSMHFYFNRLGFVPLVWGLPKVNQTGKQSGKAQSLVFPFDRSSKAGASTEFLNRFGQALAATVPLSRGKSQLSIAVSHLAVSESEKLLDVVFSYVDEAYKPTS